LSYDAKIENEHEYEYEYEVNTADPWV